MKSKILKLFYRWHRRLGATAALFFFWIVISGWLLNHAEFFQLQQKYVHSSFLAGWYGLKIETPDLAFTTEHHWITANEQFIFFDGVALNNLQGPLVGVAETKKFIALLTPNTLYLLTQAGEPLDKIDRSELPIKNIDALADGCGQNSDVLVIAAQTQYYASNDALQWFPCQAPVNHTQTRQLQTSEKNKILPELTPPISWEKIILDLHTGRFFGTLGVICVDLFGLALLLLAGSGFWMFLKRK